MSAATPPGTPATSALLSSFFMIIASEIGDKTFLLAAILAMRHPRLTVFAGAFLALALMSFLSAAMGHILPSLLPKAVTQALAALLFGVFGWKMWGEGRAMAGGSGKIEEELREAEEEIAGDSRGEAVELDAMEGGHALPQPNGLVTEKRGLAEGVRNLCSFFLGPVLVQSFILSFLAEWGDRSQIATIALGAAHNVYLVTLGTVLGHSCCTALAVIGGRYVSTKISVKHVTLTGGALFMLFAVIYAYEALRSWGADVDAAHQLPDPLEDALVGEGVARR